MINKRLLVISLLEDGSISDSRQLGVDTNNDQEGELNLIDKVVKRFLKYEEVDQVLIILDKSLTGHFRDSEKAINWVQRNLFENTEEK